MKIASALPKGTQNGLVAIDRALVNEPEQEHLVIARVDCKSITTDTDTGDTEPTVRILHVEVVDPKSQAVADRLLRAAYARRTGDNTLPFDPVTGEVDE